jgi:hypothetical protein
MVNVLSRAFSDELATAKERCAVRKRAMRDEMNDKRLLILTDQRVEFQAEATELESAREVMAHEVESIRARLATMDSPEKLLALISDPANNDVRLRLRAEIRRKISRIDVRFGLDGIPAVADVKFINGLIAGIIFVDKRTTVMYSGEYDSSVAPSYDESELSDCSFWMDVPF